MKKRPVDLASSERYNMVDWAKLTEKDITEFDNKGKTFLHYVARHALWSHLPIPLRDKKYWQKSKDGETIYMSAFYSSCQSWIDKSDLTKEVILKKDTSGNFIALLATHRRNLNFLPKELITKDVLMEETLEEDPLSLTGTKKGRTFLFTKSLGMGKFP
jgi:hypothetical protein